MRKIIFLFSFFVLFFFNFFNFSVNGADTPLKEYNIDIRPFLGCNAPKGRIYVNDIPINNHCINNIQNIVLGPTQKNLVFRYYQDGV